MRQRGLGSLVAYIITVALAVGCGDGPTVTPPPPPPPAAFLGSYDVVSVAGEAPPTTLVDFTTGIPVFDLGSGSLEIRGDNTYTAIADLTNLFTGVQISYVQPGVWTLQGSNIVITPNDGECSDTLTFDGGDQIQIPSDCLYRVTWVFERR